MKKIVVLFLFLALSGIAHSHEALRVETLLRDMTKEQQVQVAALVNAFNVEKFSAKLCYNYIVAITRTAELSVCVEAIRACNIDPKTISHERLDTAIAKSALTGNRVIECFETLAQYNQKLPAFNCLSERSDSNLAILRQLESSRFPQEVECCIEELRAEQIGFH